MRQLGFKNVNSDLDFWIRLVKDGYEYIATYVDDLMIFSHNPMDIVREIQDDGFVLKGVGIPEYYLGGDIEDLDEHWNADGIAWALSAKTYIKTMVERFEQFFDQQFNKESTPYQSNFHSELDYSPFLDNDLTAIYRSIIGSCNWDITLGRYDIL